MAENIRGPERRIVLVGQSGTGKSATGNTILGSRVFESKDSEDLTFGSVTQRCQREEVTRRGREVVVVDTPGFLTTGRPDRETAAELSRGVRFCSPGPHVILQVVHPRRFTQKEEMVAQMFKEIFDLKAKNYVVFLFTHKEDLKGKPLEDFIREGNSMLKAQVARCGNRYLAFNNRAEGEEREAQVDQLMAMIDQLVEKNKDAPCYTEEMIKQDKEVFQESQGCHWWCPLL